MPRPPPPFPQRLVKKNEDGKYRCFITMLKQLSINVPLVEAREQMSDYAKFNRDLITKKRSVTFEDDDKLVKGSGEAEESTGKDAEVPMKVILMPRTPPPFPQRLVKKTEDGKYRHFITMLKQLSIMSLW